MASEVTTSEIAFPLQPGYVLPYLAGNTNFRKMFAEALPKDLMYNDILVAPAVERYWTQTLADNGNSFTPANIKFTVTLRSTDLFDNNLGFLGFTLSGTASDGSSCYFQQGSWNACERVKILINGVTVADHLDKAKFESLCYAFSRDAMFDSTLGLSLFGIGSVAQRQAWFASNNVIIPMAQLSSLLTAEQWIMGVNNGMVIEFYMAAPTSCICYAPGAVAPFPTLNYTISNPIIYNHEVKYPPLTQKRLLSLSPVRYPYTNYKSFQTQIQAGQTQLQFVIPVRVQSVQKILAFMRPSSDINNPAVPDVLTTDFQYNQCQQYQLQLNNSRWPPQPINAGGSSGAMQAYIECLSCMNAGEVSRLDVHRDQNNGSMVWKDWGKFPVSIQDFTNNRFLACFDLKCTTDNDPNYIQPFDVTPGNTQLILQMWFPSGQPASNQTLYVFVVHTTITEGDNQGNYRMIE